ncbi:hypothetical protein AGOR_G00233400 [Albula goreensis]|uniref:Hemogen n=1 Tax=Albula goreensis TaxID=1534307 RepID=A0A8T3CGA4_9TELE|nr:hypothetical protein AGOR_G00233400 [Albula goreensis]
METLEKDTTQVECKQPDDNQGGIRGRLRDRDLLRKRRAEAEEKAIYQWVYGVQSKRKTVRREGKSGPGRKGRPRKSEASSQEVTQDGKEEEGLPQGVTMSQANEQLSQDTTKEEEPLTFNTVNMEAPVTTDTTKGEEPPAKVLVDSLSVDPSKGKGESLSLPLLQSPPLLSFLPSSSLFSAPPVTEPQPEVVPSPAPAPPKEETPQVETKSSLPAEEPEIEDLGPEEEEFDVTPVAKPIVEKGASEEPGDKVTDSTQLYSIPAMVSPPQPSYLPGPSL